MNKKLIISCLSIMLFSSASFAQEMAKGYVFEDANNDGVKGRREKGITGVAVTNGVDVVLTDKKGFYEVMVGKDAIISVIKPSNFQVRVNENQLPQNFYIHKPQGSPKLKYEGVKPTGPLPKEINFPLVKQEEGDSFKMILLGDPQVHTLEEVAYFRDAIISELENAQGYAFGLSLGDLVGNNPDLFNPYIQTTKAVGIPWYNVMGNHDINFDVKADSLSDESYEAHFGSANYAFNYSNVHFIVMDDIIYPDPRDGAGYLGGLNEKQLQFIENDLKYVPNDHLVVLAFHIPITNERGFRREDRDRLFELLKDFPYTLSLSAHTHRQYQAFLSKEEGWLRNKPHHHFNAGTTSGNWYSGALNKQGVPVAMMSDGTPKGYSFINFNGNQYTIDYKVAGEPKEHQIGIYAAKVLAQGIKSTLGVYANFYMGSSKDTVMVRVNDGKWKVMKKVEEYDPTFIAEHVRWDMAEELIPGRRPGPASISNHLWKSSVSVNLPAGTHTIEVKAKDMFGRTFTEKRSFKIIVPVH